MITRVRIAIDPEVAFIQKPFSLKELASKVSATMKDH
jgi:hypothetical protein